MSKIERWNSLFLITKIRELSSQSQITDNQVVRLLEYDNHGEKKMTPSPAVESQLKMVLFSASELTSPNYTGPPFIADCEFLLDINELKFLSTK